ncbi:MAG: hypothetical protein JSU87_14460 [Gemmatimonadota bacterium]|nr:MAG: hypothetical protein JSU87_14460 [Gemmatimonadota bacterium]
MATRLSGRGAPGEPQLIEFQWRYRGREGRFSGDGGLRVNPPDSVRLDLLGPGWSGVQSAVVVGDVVHYVGEQRVILPPPAFMWTLLGVFRPPAGLRPDGYRRGERTQLDYQLSARETLSFHFDGEGRLIEAELRRGGDVVQRIEIEPGEPGGDPSEHQWPQEARYRDLGEFHEVRIKVTEIRPHAPFEQRIFSVPAL